MKIVHIEVKSLKKQVFFQPIRISLKGKNSPPTGAERIRSRQERILSCKISPFMKRNGIDENLYSFQ